MPAGPVDEVRVLVVPGPAGCQLDVVLASVAGTDQRTPPSSAREEIEFKAAAIPSAEDGGVDPLLGAKAEKRTASTPVTRYTSR